MRSFAIIVAASAFLLAGCEDKPKAAPALGHAFVGPITVELRDDLIPTAKVVAKVKHGDRVAIVQTRRRFVRVRTEGGIEGWTDSRRLLTPEQMQELSDLSARAAKLASMGKATVYDLLNMHSEPHRYSTSFYQITPGVQVDVLAHKAVERTATAPAPVPIVKRPPPPPKRVKPKKEAKIPPVPKPPAPALPANWMELSKTDLPDEPEPEPEVKKPAAPKAPVRMDDWTFVRAPNGKAGWVLSRMLLMSIPDEVAQYSEGARITSYFSLEQIDDEGQKKHHWLWTTASDSGVQHDFDSFRVFIWNQRRDRYETSYIERDVEGYFPVEVDGPRFTLTLRRKDGGFYRKSFSLEGHLTRWTGNADTQPPADPLDRVVLSRGPGAPPATSASQSSPGFVDRVKAWTKKVLNRS
jgi:hypothetical protein